MWIIIGEISVCLIITLTFGFIMGWYLANSRKEREYEVVSSKFLEAEKEITHLKKELVDCRNALLNEHK